MTNHTDNKTNRGAMIYTCHGDEVFEKESPAKGS
jgi:hypothetical protein